MKYLKIGRSSVMFLLFVLSFQLSLYAERKPEKEIKRMYRTAEYNFFNENYAAALPLFIKLDSIDGTNANLKFKIGYCYLHSAGRKVLSIPYFEAAAKNTSPDYVEYSVKELRAPQSTHSYLARAYQLDYKFDKAISMYEKYRAILGFNPIYEEEIKDINHDIQTCKNAKDMFAYSSHYTISNLGPNINSPYADYAPVLSLDEKMLIFTSRRAGGGSSTKELNGKYFEDIYVSTFENHNWTEAQSIGSNINSKGNEATVNLSADGQTLLIYKDDKGDGNLYISVKLGDGWSTPTSFNENINSPHWETHAAISSDNNTLYFVSDRPGGYGGRDIYKSLRLPNGEWSAAQNLGPMINTAYEEDGVFIHPDGKQMFFSSKGHNTIGGFDIFKSTIDPETRLWAKPENMGYPINSPDNDIFFVVTADGERGYFSSDKKGGRGGNDIYMIDFRGDSNEALTLLKGVVTLNGAKPEGGLENVEIVAVDVKTSEVVANVKPVATTGKYVLLLSSGLHGKSYFINCTAEEYEPINFLISVPPDSTYQEIKRSLKLQFVNFSTKSDSLATDSLVANIVITDSTSLAAIESKIKENKAGVMRAPEVATVVPASSESFAVGDRIDLGYFLYDTDNSLYQKAFKEEFTTLLRIMKKHPKLVIEVGGHTDSVGSEMYNFRLSKLRAQLIVDLLKKSGVSGSRMKVKGYGESVPFAPNSKSDGRPDQIGMKLNRRVELKVIEGSE